MIIGYALKLIAANNVTFSVDATLICKHCCLVFSFLDAIAADDVATSFNVFLHHDSYRLSFRRFGSKG